MREAVLWCCSFQVSLAKWHKLRSSDLVQLRREGRGIVWILKQLRDVIVNKAQN